MRENIDFYAAIYGLGRAGLDERRRMVVQLAGLDNRMEQLAGTLSGGFKQRLALVLLGFGLLFVVVSALHFKKHLG